VGALGIGFNLRAGQINEGPAELADVRLGPVRHPNCNALLIFPLHVSPPFRLNGLQACNVVTVIMGCRAATVNKMVSFHNTDRLLQKGGTAPIYQPW
jgi:hypothetical protein